MASAFPKKGGVTCKTTGVESGCGGYVGGCMEESFR